MGSHSLLPLAISSQIPVINFSDKTLKPGSSKWDEVKLDVRKALEDYGCFEASFDKVSVELNKSVLEVMEELSELPIQTKERNVSSKPLRGYTTFGHKTFGVYQKSFGIDDANVLDKAYDFTQQLWPGHGNKSISETIHRFSEQLSELDVMVRRMVMESFGIEKYLDEHLNSSNYMLKLLEYKAPLDADIEETQVVDPHTDWNILTIIHQCQVDGLEVKAKDGKWSKAKAAQDSFIVMVGDSFSALMNGRVIPAYHRVVMKGKKTRYSTALFSIPKLEVIIDTPEELVDEEHPRLFKPYAYGKFVDFLTTEAGRRAQLSLKHNHLSMVSLPSETPGLI